MLVSVSFCWLILTAPFNLNTMLALNGIRTSSRDVNVLLKTLCFCLMYINHSINLLLYCFTGRKFRLELKVSAYSPLSFTIVVIVVVNIFVLLTRYWFASVQL